MRQPSLEDWESAARGFQRIADERRIKEIRRRDEQPMVVGLALLAVLAITAFCLIVIGLVT